MGLLSANSAILHRNLCGNTPMTGHDDGESWEMRHLVKIFEVLKNRTVQKKDKKKQMK